MARLHLPTQTLHPDTTPEVVDRSTWQNARDDLLAREKAHTREGDAIAAARRRLPMTQIPDDATVEGPNGQVPFLDVFEDGRMLFAYFHMWHDGAPWERQCEGCISAPHTCNDVSTCTNATSPSPCSARGRTARASPTRTSSVTPCPGLSPSQHGTDRWSRLRVHRLLPAQRRPRLRDLLEHRSRHRGHGHQLPPPRPHGLRAARRMGRLTPRLAPPVGRPASVARSRPTHRAMGSHRRAGRTRSGVPRPRPPVLGSNRCDRPSRSGHRHIRERPVTTT